MARRPKVAALGATTARAGERLINGWPVVCSRELYLEDKTAARAKRKEFVQCARISRLPGFGKIASMQYKK